MHVRVLLISVALTLEGLGSVLMAAEPRPIVAVVGAGPAGMALVDTLSSAGVGVLLFDGATYVGGNVAHGYFYTKNPQDKLDYYRQVISRSNVQFFGGVKVGRQEAVSLDDLVSFDVDAVVFTNGAAPRKLQVPGGELAIPANSIFYYYNGHRDYVNPPSVGKRIAWIGSGSTGLDGIKYQLMQNRGVQIYQLVRRGPGQYGHKGHAHFGNIFDALNRGRFLEELRRIAPDLHSVGEDVESYIRDYYNFQDHYDKYPRYSREAGAVEILHLVSPVRILHEGARVTGIELERNKLVKKERGVEAESTGETFTLPVDTVIQSLGGVADPRAGLPMDGDWVRTVSSEDHRIRRDADVTDAGTYFKTRNLEHYAVDFSKEARTPRVPVFVAGWARLPGVGATEEGNDRFSNVPDGRRLGELLVERLNDASAREGRAFSGLVEDVSSKLRSRKCSFVLESLARPQKRPTMVLQ